MHPFREVRLTSPFLDSEVLPGGPIPGLVPVEQFGADEHRAASDHGLQEIVDHWADHGLIEGGAFVNRGAIGDITKGAGKRARPLKQWEIGFSKADKPAGARWHWIGPDPARDSRGKAWTADSLKREVSEKKAVCLSPGQIMLLAGDLVESFDQLKRGNPVAKPVGIMQGYELNEPVAWSVFRIKLLNEARTPYQHWLGWKHILQVFVGDAKDKKLASLRLLQALKEQYPSLQRDITQRRKGWAATGELVDALRSVCSAPFGNLHLLAQLLEFANPIAIDDIKDACPWCGPQDAALFRARSSGVKAFDPDMIQIIATSGIYLELALNNEKHFNPENWEEFDSHFKLAARMVGQQSSRGKTPPFPADAIAALCFGLHYLQDAFAAGHMRTPRTLLGKSGGMAAKAMHDFENRNGLYVENGLGDKWLAVGDGRLFEALDTPLLAAERKGKGDVFWLGDGVSVHQNQIFKAVKSAAEKLMVVALMQKNNQKLKALETFRRKVNLRKESGNIAGLLLDFSVAHRPVPLGGGTFEEARAGKRNYPPMLTTGQKNGKAVVQVNREYRIEDRLRESFYVKSLTGGRGRLEISDYYYAAMLEPDAALLRKWAPSQGFSRDIFKTLER